MSVTPTRATEIAMSNLMHIFNERDADQRMEEIIKTYDPNMRVHEPDNVVTGHEAINRLCSELLDKSPGWNFKPAGPVMLNHRVVTMRWVFGPAENPEQISGQDVMVVNERGLIEALYIMIDGVSEVK